MKKIGKYGLTTLFVIFFIIFMGHSVSADDTCVFSITADDLPPNIVLLLDSGAEMEQVVWRAGFDNSIDYTPAGASIEVVGASSGTGDGFLNDKGYGIVKHGSTYRLVAIPDNLEIDDYTAYLNAFDSTTGMWKINGRQITLPAEPSTVAVDGVIDNASHFRYSKNYLNWLFFAAGGDSYFGLPGVHDGTDLPNMSRFYYAKKAIMTVAKGTKDKAKFGIYYFTNTKGGSQAQPPCTDG